MSIFGLQDSVFIGHDFRCLVVGDIEAMRKTTVNQLRQLGVDQIRVVKSEAEALRALDNQVFDVVLVDWKDAAGLELLKAIRSDKNKGAVPVVLMTVEAERSRVEEAISYGVTSVLLKPYSSNQLLSRLERAYRRKSRSGSRPLAASGVGQTQAAHAGAQGQSDSGLPARPAILIVDDTPENLILLSHLFQEEYRVQLAETGDKAFDILTSVEPPDLVLLDVMMPGMDGFEVARRMRDHPNLGATPIIFLTALTSADSRLKGLDLGAIDFIVKPLDLDTLKLRVRNFMRHVQMRKDLQSQYDTMVEMAQLREQMESITRQDLKAPLAGLLGVMQSLLEDDALGRRQIEQLRLIEETVLRVLGMITLSSELYKIETGQFDLKAEPVSIGDLLRRLAETSRVTYLQKGLSISVDCDVPVGIEQPRAMGDATMCYATFQSLMSRACEAAPANSSILVSLFDEFPLRVIVRNAGGMSPMARERFFDRRVMPGQEENLRPGTYSSKLMVEAQHGTIALTVADEPETTTVTVTLPRASRETQS